MNLKKYSTDELEQELQRRENKKNTTLPKLSCEYFETQYINTKTLKRLYSVHISDGCEGFTYLIHSNEDIDKVKKIALYDHLTKCYKLGFKQEEINIFDITVEAISYNEVTYLQTIEEYDDELTYENIATEEDLFKTIDNLRYTLYENINNNHKKITYQVKDHSLLVVDIKNGINESFQIKDFKKALDLYNNIK